MKKMLLLAACVFVLLATPAFAVNECITTTATDTVKLPARLTWTQSDLNATGGTPAVPVIGDFLGEVLQGTTVVANWTIPKTSVTPVPSGPTGCVQTPIPAMAGLLVGGTYTVRLKARGPSGDATGPLSNPFQLPAAAVPAPSAPGNIRVVQ